MPEAVQQPTPQPQVEDKPKNKKSIFKFILILEIVIILLGGVYVGYLYITKDKETTSETNTSQTDERPAATSTSSKKLVDPKKYSSKKMGFEFDYPKDWFLVFEQSDEISNSVSVANKQLDKSQSDIGDDDVLMGVLLDKSGGLTKVLYEDALKKKIGETVKTEAPLELNTTRLSDISVDGLEGVRVETHDFSDQTDPKVDTHNISVYLKRDNNYASIGLVSGSEVLLESSRLLFEEMISSLKFLD